LKHHALVKGDQIVSSPRPRAIDLALQRKIAAYRARWQSHGEGRRLLERIVDQAKYRALRAYDRLTAVGFCFLPLFLLIKYRAWKYGSSASGDELRRAGSGASIEVNP
jgi:hypothetical protein